MPGTVVGMLWYAYDRRPPDSVNNGHNAWHAATNAFLAKELGLVGSPFILLGGILHETPIDHRAFYKEFRDQGILKYTADSSTDIIANIAGMVMGYMGISVENVGRIGNYIPGPGDPDPNWQ